ncbi:MAG: DUF4203 domain-containing protein [Verrucomicrobiota bacterium]
MPLFNILVGAALLLFGRRLFWVFVAGVGFVTGVFLADEWFGEQSEMAALVVALCIGVVGAVVSVFLQRLVVGIAGFLAGGYVAHALATGLDHPQYAWVAFAIGGIVGIFLMLTVFNAALIALSTLLGALVIIDNLPLDDLAAALLFLALFVFGALIQSRGLMRPAPVPQKAKT